MRDQGPEPDWREERRETPQTRRYHHASPDDDLRPISGILLGVLLGTAFWAAVVIILAVIDAT